MPVPVRSIRLQKRSTKSLNTLSGASGEIFFDEENRTLRLYTANQSGAEVLATRDWVNQSVQGFSGDYNDLINTPPNVSDINQLSDIDSLLFSGDYEDLANKPDLESLVPDITTINAIGDVNISGTPEQGQLLVWDGSIWVNQTVSGFEDTNTEYTLTGDSLAGGAQAVLTDSDTNQQTLQFLAGTGISVTLTSTNEITIANTDTNQLAVNDLTDASITNIQDGQSLVYSSGQWINGTPSGGVDLTSFTVTENTAGTASLTYDDTTGQFSYTPPDLSSVAQLDAFSVTTDAAQSGGSLSYDDNGGFTFRPANLSGLSTLTSFSVSTDAASGGGSLSYNNQNGVFTFVPADIGSGGGGGSGAYEFELTDDGGSNNDYLFTNTAYFPGGSVADPDLYLRRGETYTFSNISGAHPFQIQSTAGISGTAYNTGVTNNNTVGDVVFTVPMDAPKRLYYQCTAHANMGGNIFISDSTEVSLDTTPVLGGNLDANSNDITNVGTITATTYANAGAGAPQITSASTVTITAPDGFIVTGGATGGPFRLPSFTTTEKNAITAVNGDIIYDSTISQAQVYEGSWTSISGGGGIALTDLSVGAEGTASGDGAIAYNDGTGVFTYTPPDLSSYLTSVPAQSFSSLTGKPTTLAGYGITDAFDGVFSSLTSKPTTLAGYGITDSLSASAAPRISEVSSTINGATGTVVHNTTTGGVFYHTAPAANFTANFTNVPTTNDRITTVALIIAQGVTQYMPTAVQIGGAAQTIEWFGGSVPGGTANGFDIVSFTLIRQSSTWTVLGASSTYG
jgi:hypothetical protein